MSTAHLLDAFGDRFGIEEEYHLVDRRTLSLRPSPVLAARTLDGAPDSRLRPEMLTSQLEAATEVCADLPGARSAIVAMRAEAADAAALEDAAILATSTHPSAALTEIRLMQRDRYDRLVDRFGSVVRAFNLCGAHIHVSVPELDAAVAVMSHARPYLPLLSVLTASSPFHEGIDTGYQSFRIAWLSLWQQGGLPPHLDSAADYHATVDQLTAIGLVDEPSEVLWELRPSSRYPTLEFRIADVTPHIDDVVLLAALVRALVRTLAARVLAGAPAPAVSDTVLRAARWRAARYGLAGSVWDPVSRQLVPCRVALDALLTELAPALREFGDEAPVRELLAQVLDRGTSAQSQRARYSQSRNLHEVVRDAVATTALR